MIWFENVILSKAMFVSPIAVCLVAIAVPPVDVLMMAMFMPPVIVCLVVVAVPPIIL